MINITKIKNFLYELDNEIGEIKDTLKEAWEMSDLKELLSDISVPGHNKLALKNQNKKTLKQTQTITA